MGSMFTDSEIEQLKAVRNQIIADLRAKCEPTKKVPSFIERLNAINKIYAKAKEFGNSESSVDFRNAFLFSLEQDYNDAIFKYCHPDPYLNQLAARVNSRSSPLNIPPAPPMPPNRHGGRRRKTRAKCKCSKKTRKH